MVQEDKFYECCLKWIFIEKKLHVLTCGFSYQKMYFVFKGRQRSLTKGRRYRLLKVKNDILLLTKRRFSSKTIVFKTTISFFFVVFKMKRSFFKKLKKIHPCGLLDFQNISYFKISSILFAIQSTSILVVLLTVQFFLHVY